MHTSKFYCRTIRALASFLVLSACLPGMCLGQSQASQPLEPSALLEIVREYGENKPPVQAARAGGRLEASAASSPSTPDDAEQYKSHIQQYLIMRSFAQLEREVRKARDAKLRFPGGVWMLLEFYEALGQPLSGDNSRDIDYTVHMAKLQQWAKAYPESAAPRIALAQSYISYADMARGTGYANTVTPDGWKLDRERTATAASILAEAAGLKDKDPYWYEVMQQIALGQGWGKAQARELLENAVAFEPGFYHFYRQYANYLLPKWYGEPGEAESFAVEISNRVGGEEGKFLYFEIATLLTCRCDSDDSDMENLSWPKIKQGYAALQQLYGVSSLKTNRFAYMAVEAGDKAAAAEAFASIGEDWDSGVWRSPVAFKEAKAWAAGK